MLFLNEEWFSADEKQLVLGHRVTYKQEKMKYSDAIIKDEIFMLILPLVMLFDETGSNWQTYIVDVTKVLTNDEYGVNDIVV